MYLLQLRLLSAELKFGARLILNGYFIHELCS